MAELRRKAQRRYATPVRVQRTPVQRPALRLVRRPVAVASKPMQERKVTAIQQFKNSAGRYLVAVYTKNPRTQREERVIVDPKTLSPEKLKQLKEWHAHHKNKGKWIHAIATDPHTWATIGKILLAA